MRAGRASGSVAAEHREQLGRLLGDQPTPHSYATAASVVSCGAASRASFRSEGVVTHKSADNQDSEQIGNRTWLAEVDQRRVDPVLERRLVLDQVQAKAGQLALLPHPRVGQPDRWHQVPLAQRRQDPRVDLVGLAGQRSETLDLLSVGDLDRPARLLERVMHEASTAHRFDHRANGLAIGLPDPPRQAPQRVAVRRRDQLIQMLSLLGEQAHIDLLPAEIQPGMQH